MPHVLLATLVFSASAIFATPIGVANTRVVRSLDFSNERIRTADYSLKGECYPVVRSGSPEFAFTANGRRYTGIDSWREIEVSRPDGSNALASVMVSARSISGAVAIRLGYEAIGELPLASLVIGNLRLDAPNHLLGFKSLVGTLPILLGEPAEGAWDGFQRINTETKSGGLLGVFRQNAGETTRQVVVAGLDPEAAYEIRRAPTGEKLGEWTGRDLAEKGFAVTLPAACDGEIYEVQNTCRR